MFSRLQDGLYWDERWEVIARRERINREALSRPYGEKAGKVYLIDGDLFHPDLSLEDLDCILSVVASNPQHLFMAVTGYPELSLVRLYGTTPETTTRLLEEDDALHNLWFLVRMSDQAEADLRIPATIALKNCWVADGVRWPVVGVLADPLRGELDLRQVNSLCVAGFGSIDWVVCGFGNVDTDPAERQWVQSLRNQAEERGIPFLFTGRDGGVETVQDGRFRNEAPPFRKEQNHLHIFDHCREHCTRDRCRCAA